MATKRSGATSAKKAAKRPARTSAAKRGARPSTQIENDASDAYVIANDLYVRLAPDDPANDATRASLGTIMEKLLNIGARALRSDARTGRDDPSARPHRHAAGEHGG